MHARVPSETPPASVARRHRGMLAASVAIAVLALVAAAAFAALERQRLSAERAAWVTTGERSEAPPAASGHTRAFQDAH